MLTIHVSGTDRKEAWDPIREEFVSIEASKPVTLMLEHSLLSISKWESKYHKPFLGGTEKDQKTPEEMLYYIQCMTVNSVDENVYYRLTNDQIQEIGNYIADSMTATTINHNSAPGAPKRNKEIITSELIYYWMVVHQIPFECQKWHLNRLLTLIEVCNIKNAPSKKMSKQDIMRQNRSLNAARRAKHHSHG